MFHFVDRRAYGGSNSGQIFTLSKGNEWLLQRMSLLRSLEVHRGCVNSVVWDNSGELLLSGSDDQHLVISNPWSGKTLLHQNTAHRANIFCAKFLPNSSNQRIVSCSGDGVIIYTDLNSIDEEIHKFSCHVGTCYDVVTLPGDPQNFLTCGEDGTVRLFDLRRKMNCSARNCKEDTLLYMNRAVTALAINPVTPYQMCVATQDSMIRIYDRRMLGTRAQDSYLEESNQALLMRLKPGGMEGKNNRVTSLKYSSLGDQVLASYSSDYLYLFDTQTFCDIPLENVQGDRPSSPCMDDGQNEGPTLKRLRLRGDWSDTGPQAVPESELRNNASDVGQARPTLQSTLMQRMTDILSRMLQRPSTRRTLSESGQGPEGSDEIVEVEEIVGQEDAGGSATAAAALEAAEGGLAGPTDSTQNPLSESSNIEYSNLNAEMEGNEDLVNQRAAVAEVSPRESPNVALNSVINVNVENDIPINDNLSLRNDAILPVELIIPPEISEDSDQSSRTMEQVDGNPESNMDSEDSRAIPDSNRLDLASERPQDSNMNEVFASNISNIEATLVSMRQDFRERHSVDPSVDLSYSGIGASSGVISLGVGDELSRNCEDLNNSPVELVGTEPVSPLPNVEGENTTIEQEENVADSTISAHCSEDALNAPSTSGVDNDSKEKLSGKRPVPGQEKEVEDEATKRRRNTSAKMARAIDKAVQKIRGEEAARIDGPKGSIIPQGVELQRYKGHRNARTMIKEACFWGENHVMSGSDCGRVFVWNKRSGRLVMLFEADAHVVNCLQPHPYFPILATSGIDYNVKLWAPTGRQNFDQDKAEEISHRNEALLAETKDTITVPATFMIRMLASLNQIRQDRNRGTNPSMEDEDD